MFPVPLHAFIFHTSCTRFCLCVSTSLCLSPFRVCTLNRRLWIRVENVERPPPCCIFSLLHVHGGRDRACNCYPLWLCRVTVACEMLLERSSCVCTVQCHTIFTSPPCLMKGMFEHTIPGQNMIATQTLSLKPSCLTVKKKQIVSFGIPVNRSPWFLQE